MPADEPQALDDRPRADMSKDERLAADAKVYLVSGLQPFPGRDARCEVREAMRLR